jgi:hypothetical protein
MAVARWIVLIADVKSSRQLPPVVRGKLPAQLQSAVRRSREFAPHAYRLEPEILKGDELQAVLRAEAPALVVVTHLRASLYVATEGQVELRVGLGSGAIDRLSMKGPFESDGPAFHQARAAIDAVRRQGASRRTAWSAGRPEFDELADVTLSLADAISNRWTLAQWQAVRERIEGKELRRIAALEDISVQSISKRLITASWTEFLKAATYLDERAADRGSLER